MVNYIGSFHPRSSLVMIMKQEFLQQWERNKSLSKPSRSGVHKKRWGEKMADPSDSDNILNTCRITGPQWHKEHREDWVSSFKGFSFQRTLIIKLFVIYKKPRSLKKQKPQLTFVLCHTTVETQRSNWQDQFDESNSKKRGLLSCNRLVLLLQSNYCNVMTFSLVLKVQSEFNNWRFLRELVLLQHSWGSCHIPKENYSFFALLPLHKPIQMHLFLITQTEKKPTSLSPIHDT